MRAWILISERIGPNFDFRAAASQIRQSFKSDIIGNAISVLGPYDVVVEVQAAGVDAIYSNCIKKINSLPTVGGLSTYLAVGTPKTKEKELESPTAYILIDALPEYLEVVQGQIFDFDVVQKCDIVLGPYDIIAEVVTKGLKQLTELVAQIRRLNGVAKTLTMTVT